MTTQPETHGRLCAVRQLCSFSAVLPQVRLLAARGWDVLPILSASAARQDNPLRHGRRPAADLIQKSPATNR